MSENKKRGQKEQKTSKEIILPGFTNVLLFENEILKDKMAYILKLIEDFLDGVSTREPETIELIETIENICNNECCCDCKYWLKNDKDENKFTCYNLQSEFKNKNTEMYFHCYKFKKR